MATLINQCVWSLSQNLRDNVDECWYIYTDENDNDENDNDDNDDGKIDMSVY